MQRPPKLKLPSTSGRRMALIGMFFVVSLVLYQCAVSSNPRTSVNQPASGYRPTASEVAEIVAPAAKVQPLVKGGAEPRQDKGGAELQHDDVVVSTGFSGDWSVRNDGRQKILTHKNGESICQSLVIPISEYNAMLQEAGSLENAQRAIMDAAMEQVAPQAKRSATVTKLFQESGPPIRVGSRVEGSVSVRGRTARMIQITVWTANAKNAASLTCARVGTDASDTTMLEQMVRAYKFKMARN